MKIYVFGNPLIKEDSLPEKLIPQLKETFPKIEFVIADPNENFPPENERDLIILDTVVGIKKPVILNLDHLQQKNNTPVSPHDYDLLIHLQLLKKIKKIDKVKIIGVPIKTKIKDLINFISKSL